MTQIRRIFTDLFSYPRASVSSVQSVFYHNITLNRHRAVDAAGMGVEIVRGEEE